MKLSLNWIRDINKRYACSAEPASEGVDKLVEKIGAQLGAVDEVIDLGKRYEGIVVVKVVSVEKHPNADKLTVCLIDDGKAVKGVKRDKNGLVEVVCGAPNVKPALAVAWIPPGAAVPATYDKEPFVLEARDIRGITSNGMLASPKELALGDSHEGLLIIDEPVKPGTPFAEVYGLDDHIIDIENKMFTHRPDLFGTLGLAREIAGIQNIAFTSPAWYSEDAAIQNDGRKNVLKLAVKNKLPKLVPRFTAVALKDVKVEDSPLWLKSYMIRMGLKSINNIVDLTNFFMLETAQPLHAYDYDKLKTGVLGIRQAKAGEELALIGGKKIKLRAGDIIITDGRKPIGLGGIMGGAGTEVGVETKNIVLEAANFDMNTTRRTAMQHGLFTDAATRFTKNQSPRQTKAVLIKMVDDVKRIAGGRVVSPIIDEKQLKLTPVVVVTDAKFINSRLGLDLEAKQMKQLLENVEFQVKLQSDILTIVVPFWRTDIEIAEDIVEEVGRLYGYDRLPVALPSRSLAPPKFDQTIALKNLIRQLLAEAGGNEVLTYSFVDDSLLNAAGQDKKDAFHIRNAISPKLKHYRLSLTPSLLEKVQPNLRLGFEHFMLFELGRAHVKGVLDHEKLPAELERLAIVKAAGAKVKSAGAPYFEAKHLVDFMLDRLGVSGVNYQPFADAKLPPEWEAAAKAYEPERTSVASSGNEIIGIIGEPTAQAAARLKLPARASQAELDLSRLLKLASEASYEPLNRYPELEQDLCLRTTVDLSYGELTSFIDESLKSASEKHGYGYRLEPLDVFQREGSKSHKQTTWRIKLWHPQRTLTTEESNRLLDELADAAKTKLKAERI